MFDILWYYVQGGQQLGPKSLADLQHLAQTGKLLDSDLVWTEGMANWTPAGSITELFPTAISTPTSTAPSAPPRVMIDYYTPQINVHYAGFWIRFLAAFLDGVIVGVAGALINVGFEAIVDLLMNADLAPAQDIGPILVLFGQILGYVVMWLYEALMTSSSTQGTLGKMAVGIKVTDLSGARISFGRATGRHFAKYLSSLILGIGYIMAAFTEKKQGLHDMIAGTLVIRK